MVPVKLSPAPARGGLSSRSSGSSGGGGKSSGNSSSDSSSLVLRLSSVTGILGWIIRITLLLLKNTRSRGEYQRQTGSDRLSQPTSWPLNARGCQEIHEKNFAECPLNSIQPFEEIMKILMSFKILICSGIVQTCIDRSSQHLLPILKVADSVSYLGEQPFHPDFFWEWACDTVLMRHGRISSRKNFPYFSRGNIRDAFSSQLLNSLV
ncbi:uncharacterized protein [Dasypus novemcinctus]|uniref:uncharacterized protein isoform X2 n=1 Tax=Dasypus novemcinctus TaxID=9361 RepID=UPI0039C9491E